MFRSLVGAVGLILFPFRAEYFPELDLKLRYTIAFLQDVAYAGLLAILVYHIPGTWPNGLLSIRTAMALFAFGNLVGFILALPRLGGDGTVQPAPSAAGGQTAQAQSAAAKGSPIGFNNNLVDISDWIT